MHTNAHTVLQTLVHIRSTFSHVYQISPLLSINTYDKCLTKIELWKVWWHGLSVRILRYWSICDTAALEDNITIAQSNL